MGAAAVVCIFSVGFAGNGGGRCAKEWLQRVVPVMCSECNADDVELIGICQALMMASLVSVETVRGECDEEMVEYPDAITRRPVVGRSVVIYTTSLGALQRVRIGPSRLGDEARKTMKRVMLYASALQKLGVDVNLRWVPGRKQDSSRVPGLLVAQELAKKAGRGRGSRRRLRREGVMM